MVWDVFPSHRRLGGAPYNYAFHCGQLSASAAIASCIGTDELGREIKAAATAAGMDTSCLQESRVFPTGTVEVTLDSGKPSYEIRKDSAWDHLAFTPQLSRLAATTDAVCFGTLGQRNESSRQTIQSFVRTCPSAALKIFDINLRQDFYSKVLIQSSLELASILKVSDEELPVLADLFSLSGSVESQLLQMIRHFELRLIAYTRGAEGSLLLSRDEVSDHGGLDGEVVDTVGAGDSFTASLCMGLLRGWPLDRINESANRIATFVCSQKGATPALPEEIINGAIYA